MALHQNKNCLVLTSVMVAFLSGSILADKDSSGSDGEVEEPEENLLQCSSLPQTPEQEKYLKQHFETLADTEGNGRNRGQTVLVCSAQPIWADCSDGRANASCPVAAEKFDGSLKDLKPPNPEDEEKNLFLNPRLTISARFLSRCRKSRWAAGAASVHLSVWWGIGFPLPTPLVPQAGGHLPPAGKAPAAQPCLHLGAGQGPVKNIPGAPTIGGNFFGLREGEICGRKTHKKAFSFLGPGSAALPSTFQKLLDEKALGTPQERGSNTGKPTGARLKTKRGFLHPKTTSRIGTRWVFVLPSQSRGVTRLMAAVVPTGSHFWVKTFTRALQLLRTSFQEMLGLYDQVSTSQKWGETPAPIHSVWGGVGGWSFASPLSDDQQLMYFGHVCGVGPPQNPSLAAHFRAEVWG